MEWHWYWWVGIGRTVSFEPRWLHHFWEISMRERYPHRNIAWQRQRNPLEMRDFVERSMNSIWSRTVLRRQVQDIQHSWSVSCVQRPVWVRCETRRWRYQSYAASRWRIPRSIEEESGMTRKREREGTYDSEDLHRWPRFVFKQTFAETVEECKYIRRTHRGE